MVKITQTNALFVMRFVSVSSPLLAMFGPRLSNSWISVTFPVTTLIQTLYLGASIFLFVQGPILLPLMYWNVCFIAHLCSPLPILSLSGVNHHDCLSPCFSVVCALWVELVLYVNPPQSGLSSRCLLSRFHLSYFLCNNRVVSSRYMVIQRNAFLSDMCGDWLDVDHCMLCYNSEILP